MAIAGAVLNNKDDKKGYGDTYQNHFSWKYGPHFPRFPDTNNTRFNSHAEAAAELLKHLDFYLEFLNFIKGFELGGFVFACGDVGDEQLGGFGVGAFVRNLGEFIERQ